MMMRIFKVTGLIVLLSAFSCVRQNQGDDQRTVFRYNESSGITSLDPAFARDQAHIWAVNQLYNGLVQMDDSLHLMPCIASSWNISEDGCTYTFFLRNDVYFHPSPLFSDTSGRKVLASDFVYSFSRIVDDKLASPGAWIFNEVYRDQHQAPGFYAPDDTTFVIRLRQPFPPFAGLLAMQYCSVVPEEVVEHYGMEFRKHPVGTGPFKFKLWKEGSRLVLVKNPAYFETENGEQLPYLDAVSISFIVDKQSAFLEFIRGKLDFLSGVAPGYIDELITKKGSLNPKYEQMLNMTVQAYLNTEYLGILCDTSLPEVKSSPLKDKRVRQAINYGFDREKMIRYLRNNIGTPGKFGIIPPGMPFFKESEHRGYVYDPDKARQLLAEAGHPNGDGMPPITLSTTSSYLDLCEYIQHQLGLIGIKIKIEVHPPATLREMVAKSKLNFFRASWIADYPDMENYLALFYSRNFCPQGPNYTHFSSKEFDLLFEEARNQTNDSLRSILYEKMNRMIIDEAPVVVLYYDMVLRFTHKNITGLGSNPMNLLTLKRVKKVNQ